MPKWLKKLLGIKEKPVSTPKPIEQKPVEATQPSNTSSSVTLIEEAMNKYVADNIARFPNLAKFKNDMSFWQNHFKAVAFAESSFNQTETYEEELGKDIVTKKKNISEGYFQMSYQDSVIHGCRFDWNADMRKALKDKSKTIFNLERNLECAMIVTNKQLEKRGVLYTDGNPYYWAVLDKANKRHAVYLSKLNLYKPVSTEPKVPAATVPPIKEAEVVPVPNTTVFNSKYKRIAIIIGHGAGDSGAVGHGTNEFAYNSKVASMLAEACYPKEIKLFFRDGRGIGGVNADAKKWGGDLTIELHLNSFNGKAKGCEVLVVSGDEPSLKMGQDFADKFCSFYHRIKRDMDGVKELKKGDRGHYSLLLVNDPPPSILIEPFFIDNKDEWIEPEDFGKFLANWINHL